MHGYEGREERTGWLHINGTVCQAVGYRCTPASPDAFYFPKLGVSMHEDYVYPYAEAAKIKARQWVENERKRLDELARKIEEA